MRNQTHGTQYAYNRHRAAGEIACPACAAAKTNARRLWRAGHVDRMQLPVSLIADLYLSAPPALQAEADSFLTSKVVDVLVARRDAERAAAENAGEVAAR